MTYNIHPLFVHFPIALLVAYSVIKLLPLSKWFPAVAWKHIERALLLLGVLGAFASLATGETAEHMVRPDHMLVEMHATFAALSTWLYGALLAGEVLSFLNPMLLPRMSSFAPFAKLLALLEKILTHGAFSKLLAVIAFLAIMVTGLLGGVMVYGTTADPLAPIVLRILGLSV